jgi:hypothetical protein
MNQKFKQQRLPEYLWLLHTQIKLIGSFIKSRIRILSQTSRSDRIRIHNTTSNWYNWPQCYGSGRFFYRNWIRIRHWKCPDPDLRHWLAASGAGNPPYGNTYTAYMYSKGKGLCMNSIICGLYSVQEPLDISTNLAPTVLYSYAAIYGRVCVFSCLFVDFFCCLVFGLMYL